MKINDLQGNGHSLSSGHFCLVHVLVHVGLRFDRSRDPFHDRLSMLWGEMTIASGHRDRFVPGRFLDLLDRGSGHRQPRTECVPVGVPYIVLNPSFLQTRPKPGSIIESLLLSFPLKHGIAGFLPLMLQDSIAAMASLLR